MKRATITLPDDLEADLEGYLRRQDAPPTLTVLIQAALRRYLEDERLRERQYRPARAGLDIPILEVDSPPGEGDVSMEHDRYLAGG